MTGTALRVLHVVPSLAESFGGPSRAVHLMERCLSAEGVLVETATTVIAAERRDVPPHDAGVAAGRQVTRHSFPVDVKFYRISWRFFAWIRATVKQYDVVHVHGLFNFPSVVAAWAARRAGVPYVIRPFGVLNRYGMEQRRPMLKKLSLRLIEGRLLAGAAAVQFTSDSERDETLLLGVPLRAVVIPLCVEEPVAGSVRRVRTAFPPGAGAFRLLFMSRVYPTKNLEGAIGALGILRAAGYEPELLIAGVGDPAYVAALVALAQRLEVGRQIHWLGHVSGTAKADLLATADAFILTSWSESFGMSVVEALAAGLPCIVSDRVALAQAVKQGGAGLVVGTDANSIAAGLRACMDDGDLRARASVMARSLVEAQFSLASMGRQLMALYCGISRPRVQTSPPAACP